jgi:hypothetical protein
VKGCLIKLIIIDAMILVLHGALLLIYLFFANTRPYLSNEIIDFIFTKRDGFVVFLNIPLLILIYYVVLMAHNKFSLKIYLIWGANFISLYGVAWVQMLVIIAKDY